MLRWTHTRFGFPVPHWGSTQFYFDIFNDPRFAIVSLKCLGNAETAADYEFNFILGSVSGSLYAMLGLMRGPARLVFSSRTPFMLVYECDIDTVQGANNCSGPIRVTITQA